LKAEKLVDFTAPEQRIRVQMDAGRASRLAKKHEILASSFDKLRMRLGVFNELILMVSL
jgi:Na+-translocating ferredoxin:NAD+ oxidoreductase RnfE subunit